MRKSLIVAATEFANSVRTKSFIIGILIVPVLMGAIVVIQRQFEKRQDTGEYRVAVVDATGVLFERLHRAASEWNRTAKVGKTGAAAGSTFLVERAGGPERANETLRAQLSERVRKEEIFAFVEIPAGILDPAQTVAVRYYSNHPTYQTLPRWIETTLNAEVRSERFRTAAVDRALFERLNRAVGFDELGLVARDDRGAVKAAEQVDRVRTTAIPMVLMMLIFMPVMTITPQLVNSVLEEKMSRISEVLLGSLSPFELMFGKLLGATAVSIVLAVTYVTAAGGVAIYWGYGDVVTLGLAVQFLIFLLLALIMFGSLYLATGAACSNLKDSQSLVMPVVLIAVVPIMLWTAVLRAPDSALSVGLSMFPTATPFLMLLRVCLSPPPPLWQVVVSIVTTIAATVGVAWAAGRIFRTGLLMYGKAPGFAELVKWIRA